MSDNLSEGDDPLDFFGQVSASWEQQVTRFERAWRQGNRPQIEDCVTDHEDPNDQLLQELVRVELESRLKAGETARVEEYLERFPALAGDDQFVFELILDERRLRARCEADVSDEEYLDRFPQFRAQLAPNREPRHGSDYHLLFGLLALQNDFVSRDEIVAATGVWLADKSKPLGHILLQRNALAADEFELLSALVEKHLERHDDDVGKSLAVLSSVGSVWDELLSLGDPDLQQTLGQVSVNRENDTGPRANEISTTADSRFRILRPHARGGLGQVSVAVDEELNREVALKEILPQHAEHADSRSRFVLEAEITGGLEHPGIVPVYSLGLHADGRPFYVMRFIKGDSLQEAIKRFHATDWTKYDPGARTLQLRKLLSRFIDVCQAIEYAHSRGVLHRDLKPGNIMLGKYGETLVVDWGLAKPLGHRESQRLDEEQTLKPRSGSGSSPTQMGAAIGTPAFMPPEQAAGKLDELGPGSDVYSLGATLYYLLTGQPPFREKDLRTLLGKVRASDFPRPRDVHRDIPRSLEAVCLRAMALRYEERYTSPQDLAEDLEHWLADEPVRACREPAATLLRRWLRKHPRTVSTLAASLVVGVAGLIGISSILSLKNGQLEDANGRLVEATRAAREAKDVADDQRNKALLAQNQTEAAVDYLVRAFRSPDPDWDGRTITVAEVLDQAVVRLQSRFDDQPLVKVKLLAAIGQTYLGLGLPQPAIEVLESAQSLGQQHLAEHDRDLLTIKASLGTGYGENSQLEQGLLLLKETVEQLESIVGENDPLTLNTTSDYIRFAAATIKPSEFMALCEDHLARCRKQFGPIHPRTLDAVVHTLIAYRTLGRFREAMELIEQTLKQVPDEEAMKDPALLIFGKAIGSAYSQMGRFDEAIQLYRQSLQAMREFYGQDHPATLRTISDLATTYSRAGKSEEGVPLYEQAYDLMVTQQGPEHVNTLTTLYGLGAAYCNMGRHEDGIPLMKQAVETIIAKHGQNIGSSAEMLVGLATQYANMGRLQEAIPLLEKALEVQVAKGPENRPDVLTTKYSLATVHASARNYEAALRIMEDVVELRRAAEDPDTGESMSQLAAIYEQAGQLDKAQEMAAEAVQFLQKQVGPEHPRTLKATAVLSAAYISGGQAGKAIPLLEKTIAQQTQIHGENHPFTQWSMATLVNGYSSEKQFENAITLLKRLLELRRISPGPDHPYTVHNETQLVTLYEMTERFDEAERLQLVAVKRVQEQVPDSKELASALATLGNLLLKQGKFQQAENVLRDCVQLRENHLPDSWLLFNAKRMLGTVLAGQKKYAEAEDWLLEGYAGLEQRADDAHPIVREEYLEETVRQIIELYHAWEMPEKIPPWESERSKLQSGTEPSEKSDNRP